MNNYIRFYKEFILKEFESSFFEERKMANNERAHITKVDISDIEKRKLPTKHYVFIITVLWSDGKKQVICRRYNRFFTLQTSLIDTFPKESGAKNPRNRIIPFLPGKIFIGRSHTREVAIKRKQQLDDYIQKLLKLPEHISRCDLILDFFEASQEDIENLLGDKVERRRSVKTAENISDPILLEQFIVIANFKKTQRNQISLAAGDLVDVVEKHENGWWFVCLEDEQGWVPSSYLEPLDGEDDSNKKEEEEDPDMKFICVRAYKAALPDELTIELGDVVDIIKRCHDGWWEVRLKTDTGSKQYKGFVPVAHLKKVPKSAEAPLAEMKPSEKDRSFAAPPRKKTIKRTIAPRKSAPIKADHGILKNNNKTTQQGGESPMAGRVLPPVPANKNDSNSNEVKPPKKDEEESIYVALRNFKTDDEGSNLTLVKGEPLEVVEKSPNGWWLVKVGNEEGWIPSTFVQRQRRKSEKEEAKKKEFYITAEDFEAQDDDGMSFKRGKVVEVIEKDDEGWWYVSVEGIKGWVPSTYLDKVEGGEEEAKAQAKRVFSNSIEEVSETIPLTNDTGTMVIKKRKTSNQNLPKREVNKIEVPQEAPGRPNSAKPAQRPNVQQQTNEGEIYENTSSAVDSELTNNLSTLQIENNPQLQDFIDGNEYKVEKYVALADYFDEDEGMLHFKKGQIVNIIVKDEEGWWLGESDNEKGWVPSNYIKQL